LFPRENHLPSYNSRVPSRRLILLASVLLLGACNRAPQTKDAIKQAIVQHLQAKGSGLDMNSMSVEVVALTFNDKQAHATVSFRPKSQPDQGMEMSYTLEAKGNKWDVVGKAGSGGTPHGQPPEGAPTGLPPGHPPMGGAPPSSETPR
jgi:hypothetical protein